MEQPYYGQITNNKLHITNGGQALRYNAGQAALTTVVLLLLVSLVIGSGVSAIALKESRVSKLNTRAKESYFLAESGAEDLLYRVRKKMDYSATETLTLNNATAVTTVTDISANEKKIIAQGESASAIRNIDLRLKTGVGVSFFYGAQIGDGGLQMENTSRVNGSVYSNGNIVGNNSPTITGDAFLAGTSTVSGVTVNGTTQTGLAPLPMPIDDAQLDAWEAQTEAGGVITGPCPYKPADGASLGPIKINCDLEIDGTKIVTLTGILWIKGNIEMKNSAQLRLNTSFGQGSSVVIADNPTNRVTSSAIRIENSAQILGSGTQGSYIMAISRNNAAEIGQDEEAIDVKNSSSASIYYAPHGLIAIQNNAKLKEAVAYKFYLKNSAELTYETGLANTFFSSGPTGGWEIIDWREVK